eukprot:6491628-Pyramimonas_sp.AAC.1
MPATYPALSNPCSANTALHLKARTDKPIQLPHSQQDAAFRHLDAPPQTAPPRGSSKSTGPPWMGPLEHPHQEDEGAAGRSSGRRWNARAPD